MAIPTWMAGHAKMLAVYERPFWKEQGFSGTASSVVGPLAELHDASAPNGCPALFGFLGVTAAERQAIGLEALKTSCLQQLCRLFGPDAGHPLAVFVADWAQDPLTATRADAVLPAGHPHYGPPGGLGSTWSERLAFAGTEMATEFGGYLEGALGAACDAVERVSATFD
jgi:monoamine oxidase